MKEQGQLPCILSMSKVHWKRKEGKAEKVGGREEQCKLCRKLKTGWGRQYCQCIQRDATWDFRQKNLVQFCPELNFTKINYFRSSSWLLNIVRWWLHDIMPFDETSWTLPKVSDNFWENKTLTICWPGWGPVWPKPREGCVRGRIHRPHWRLHKPPSAQRCRKT